MVEVDIEDALRYPLRGDGALTLHAVGGGLPVLLNVVWVGVIFAAVLVEELFLLLIALFPLHLLVGIFWLGYFLRVARTTLEGAAAPPGFGDVGALFADGLWGSLLTLGYWVPVVGVMVAGYAVMFAAMLGLGSAGAGGTESALAAAGAVSVVGMLLAVLVGFALSAVAAYLLPISLVAYADEGSVTAALSPARLKTVGLSESYVVPWLLVAGVYVAVYMVVSFLTVILVGYLLVPFLPLVYFFVGMAAFRLFGRAYAVEVAPAEAGANPAAAAGSTTGSPAAGRDRGPEDV